MEHTHYKCRAEETTFPQKESFLFQPAAASDVSLVGPLYLSSFLAKEKPCQLHNKGDAWQKLMLIHAVVHLVIFNILIQSLGLWQEIKDWKP